MVLPGSLEQYLYEQGRREEAARLAAQTNTPVVVPVSQPAPSQPSGGGGGSSGGGSSGGGSTQPTPSAPTQDTGLTQEQKDKAKNLLTGEGLNDKIVLGPNANISGPTITISPDVIQANTSPSFNRPSETAIPSDLQKVTYVQKGILSQGGTPQPPPTPYVGDPNAAKNRVDKRIQSEIVPVVQKQTDIITQNTYNNDLNNLINEDYRVIGITKDANGNPQITNYEQIGALKQAGYTITNNPDGTMNIVPPANYIKQAEQKAVQAGNSYFNQQINSAGIQSSIQTIQSQEYGKENFVTVQNPDGTTNVVSRPEYERQQQFASERAGIVSRMKGEQGGLMSVAEELRFLYTGITPENFMFTQTIGELIFGGQNKIDNIVSDYTANIVKTNALIKNIGPIGAFIRGYEPGGFGFTGTLVALFMVGGPALGAVGAAGKGGAIIAKNLPLVVGGGFFAASGADIGYTFATEGQTEGAKKSLQFAAQIAMMYGIGKYIEGPKTAVTMYGQGETVQGVSIQKYYDIMGLKVKTGKPVVGVKTGMEPSYEGYGGLQSDRGLISNPYVRGLQGKGVVKPGEGKPFISSLTGERIPETYTRYEPDYKNFYSGEQQLLNTPFKPIVKRSPSGGGGGIVSGQRGTIPVSSITGKPVPKSTTGLEFNFEEYKGYNPLDENIKVQPFIKGVKRNEVIGQGERGTPNKNKVRTGFEIDYESFYEGQQLNEPFKPLVKRTPFSSGIIKDGQKGSVPVSSVTGKPIPKATTGTELNYEDYFGKQELRDSPFTPLMKRSPPGKAVNKPGDKSKITSSITGKQIPFAYTGFEYDYASYVSPPSKTQITLFYKKEIVPTKPPGKLAMPYVVSPIIQEIFPTLESGVPKYLEGMLFLKPKTRTIKQIVKPERQIKADDIFSSVSGGSQQVVLERPVVKTTQKTVTKNITSKDYMESMLQQKVETGSIFSVGKKLNVSLDTEYVQRGLWSEQINKPTMKTERGMLNVFSPVVVSGKKQGVISIEKAIQDFSFKQDSVKGNILINKVIQDLSFRQETARITSHDVLTRQDVAQGVISISDTGRISIQAKAQAKIQVPDITSITEQTTVQVPVIGMDMGFLSKGKSILQSGGAGEQAYNVQVKGKVYSQGKRIAPDNFHTINKQPLSYNDALAFGASVISKNEKASFRVVEADGKPHKLSSKVSSFWAVAHQYNRKADDTFTEKSAFRINSPGELMAITMKGIQVNRRR